MPALLVLVICGAVVAQESVILSEGWTRAMPPGSRTAAVYLQLENRTSEDLRLLRAEANIAERAEVHQHRIVDGLMQMRRVEHFRVDAGAKVEFVPGGYHFMLFGLSAVPVAGDSFFLDLSFDDGSSLRVPVTVRALGAS